MGEIEACNIAPLLFIHLLENAYKHSSARLEPGAIKVNVTILENIITFSIQNPINKKYLKCPGRAGGIGLPNVRKRLQLLYPEKHMLEINNSGETFRITLKGCGLKCMMNLRICY